MPFNLNWPELVVILLIVIVVFGAGRIGRVSSEVARGIRSLRASLAGHEQPAPEEKKP